MLVTHAYMYYDDTIYDWATKGASQQWNPHSYGIETQPGGVNDGQELWDELVKGHENFRFVFNGHVLADGVGRRATLGDDGNVVHQILANYQINTEGGQGDMRLLEFKPDGETVVVRTYSPSLDRYDTAPDQEFTLNMNQLPPPPPVLAACRCGEPRGDWSDGPRGQHGRCRVSATIVGAGREPRPDQPRRLPGVHQRQRPHVSARYSAGVDHASTTAPIL